jgi:hypothetical protein
MTSDVEPAGGRHSLHMPRRSYAIWWREGDGPRHAGKLELGRLHVLMSGSGSSRFAVPLEEISAVGYASGELMIRRRGAAPICIGSLDALGALREVADALALTPSRLLPSADL